MHILMIAPELLPVPGGGSVEICMYSIAKRLAQLHRVTIISRKHNAYAPMTRTGNLTIVRVPAGGRRKYISSVMNYMKWKHFDLIQVDNRPTFASRIKNRYPHIPVCLFLHSLTFVGPRSKPHLARAQAIIANSFSLHSRLKSMFPRESRKIKTIHLGVTVERFNPPTEAQTQEIRNRYGIGKEFTVLFVGRLIPRKGVPVLIRAMHQLRQNVPDARLVVAGGGSAAYMGELRSLADQLDVPVVFTGKIKHRDIHEIYRIPDCFVCPSQKHEAFGLVNVEAMAAGLPVIASNMGGMREIVRTGYNGYLVDSYENPEKFADFLKIIAADKNHANQLSANARSTAVRQFNWNQTASHIARLYKSMSNK